MEPLHRGRETVVVRRVGGGNSLSTLAPLRRWAAPGRVFSEMRWPVPNAKLTWVTAEGAPNLLLAHVIGPLDSRLGEQPKRKGQAFAVDGAASLKLHCDRRCSFVHFVRSNALLDRIISSIQRLDECGACIWSYGCCSLCVQTEECCEHGKRIDMY